MTGKGASEFVHERYPKVKKQEGVILDYLFQKRFYKNFLFIISSSSPLGCSLFSDLDLYPRHRAHRRAIAIAIATSCVFATSRLSALVEKRVEKRTAESVNCFFFFFWES
jgi:hypothetical protein